jgi:hypothetical protein
MAYAMRADGDWIEIDGAFNLGEGDDLVQYPPNWLEFSTDDERADRGIFAIEEPDDAPAGVKVLGMILTGVDAPVREWVTQEYTLEEAQALALTASKQVRDAQLDQGLSLLACYEAWQAIRTAILAASDVAAVQAVDLTAGYPTD